MVQSLRVDNGANHKKSVLAQYKDSKVVRELLFLAYNPYLNYYVTEPQIGHIPFYKDEPFTEDDYKTFKTLLMQVNDRSITPTVFQQGLSAILINKSVEVIDNLLLVVKRDIRSGVNVSTINAVMGNLVPDFKTMKGKKWDGKIKPSFPCWGSPKLDGYRGPSFVVNGQRGIYSNEGRFFESYSAQLAGPLHVLSQHLGHHFVFDGEVMAKDYAATSAARAADSSHRVVYYMFDCLSGWGDTDFDTRPADERYHFLENQVQDAIITLGLSDQICVVPHTLLHSEEEALAFFEKCVAGGYEGAMYVAQCSEYERTRSSSMYKLKPVRKTTVDCEIIEVLNGKKGTKYEHCIGSFVVCGVDENGTKFKANVGSGIPDNIRNKKPEDFLGRIAELNYDCITQDKDTGLFSLRFPRWKQLRTDKTKV